MRSFTVLRGADLEVVRFVDLCGLDLGGGGGEPFVTVTAMERDGQWKLGRTRECMETNWVERDRLRHLNRGFAVACP